MSDTPAVTDTTSDYDDALDDVISTMGQQTLMVSQNQMNDLRDRFKEALDDAEG